MYHTVLGAQSAYVEGYLSFHPFSINDKTHNRKKHYSIRYSVIGEKMSKLIEIYVIACASKRCVSVARG